jgi:hypothetical protein
MVREAHLVTEWRMKCTVAEPEDSAQLMAKPRPLPRSTIIINPPSTPLLHPQRMKVFKIAVR